MSHEGTLLPCDGSAMKFLRPLALLVLPLALLAAGCGGGGSALPDEDVALVGSIHITFVDLDRLLAQAERSYKLQKRDFPNAGSPEYRALQNQALQTLVQRAQLAQKAEDLGVTIPQKQIDDRLVQIKKQYFNGNEKRYQQELKRQGVTDAQVREDIKAQLVSEAISNKVTADLRVTDNQARDHYDKNASQFTQPETREVRHILVDAKEKTLADRLYQQLKSGADFATLAKKYSKDPGSKAQGGKLTITKGQTVKEFDATAFKLRTGGLSMPVKTQFGWHIIYAEKDVTPAKKTPFAQVKDVIKQQLISDRRTEKLTQWYDEVKKEFAKKTKYANGFGPIDTGTTTTTSTTG